MGFALTGAAIIGGGMKLLGKNPWTGKSTTASPLAPTPPVMPDQNTILQQQQLEEAKASALRQGRASTILTSNASTGDRLGP
jgi:hypothetical protein